MDNQNVIITDERISAIGKGADVAAAAGAAALDLHGYTVMHAVRTVDSDCKEDPEINKQLTHIEGQLTGV